MEDYLLIMGGNGGKSHKSIKNNKLHVFFLDIINMVVILLKR